MQQQYMKEYGVSLCVYPTSLLTLQVLKSSGPFRGVTAKWKTFEPQKATL